jgi:hypothetical protein
MDFSSITPNKSGLFGSIKAKISEKSMPNAHGNEAFTTRDFQMRKNGASLAFDLYKLPDFLSKTILKINKALIANEVQRQIYAKGFDETMRFLKSAAKAVK